MDTAWGGAMELSVLPSNWSCYVGMTKKKTKSIGYHWDMGKIPDDLDGKFIMELEWYRYKIMERLI